MRHIYVLLCFITLSYRCIICVTKIDTDL